MYSLPGFNIAQGSVHVDGSLIGWIVVVFLAAWLFASWAGDMKQLQAAAATNTEIPQPYVFATVWPILYLLVAVAIWHAYKTTHSTAWFWIAIVALLLNFIWTPTFTRQGYEAALNLLTLLIVVTALQWLYLLKVDPYAALLFVPYLIWLLYAFSLNSALVKQNAASA